MSIVLGVAIGILITLAVVGGYAKWKMQEHRIARTRSVLGDAVDLTQQITESTHVTDDDVDVDTLAARAIDVLNPPWFADYQPRRPGTLRTCTCHDIPINPGERVLIWPIKDHPMGALDIFCHRTVKEPM